MNQQEVFTLFTKAIRLVNLVEMHATLVPPGESEVVQIYQQLAQTVGEIGNFIEGQIASRNEENEMSKKKPKNSTGKTIPDGKKTPKDNRGVKPAPVGGNTKQK